MNDREQEKVLLRDLHELAGIQPQAEATARAIAGARAALESTIARPSSLRKSKMPLRDIGAVAAAIFLMALAVHWWLPARAIGGFAFGEVQQRVERTKSVQYVQTRKDRNKQGKTGPQESRKVAILGAHQIREEVKITTPGDPLPLGETWSAGPQEYIQIDNAQAGKTIALFPGKKGYIVPRSILAINADSGEIEENKIEAAPEIDFYKRIRDVPAEKAKKLPNRNIGGKAAAGFQVVETIDRPGGTETWIKTYWVDPQTKLPLRIETSFHSTHPAVTDSEWVQSEIVFDAELDAGLFSTDPPEGYQDLTHDDLKKE